jgi:hypothetical protein
MQKWEYLYAEAEQESLEGILKRAGEEGWELVTAVHGKRIFNPDRDPVDHWRLILKRPKS